MNRKPARVNRLQVEQLEARNLLAGNVTAHMSGGNLVITGDDLPNTIAIESFPGGAVQVRGFDDFFGEPTSINDAPNAIRLFYGVTGDIVVHMNGGDDQVRISNLVILKNLAIDMGAGFDELVMGRDAAAGPGRFGNTAPGPLFVHGEFTVNMGTQDDVLFQSDVHISGKSLIDLGQGNDTLTMARPAGTGINVEYFNDLTILPRQGDDNINITGLVSRGITLNNEAGALNFWVTSADVYGALRVVSQEQNDIVVMIATNVRGDVNVETRAGDDLFSFFGLARTITFHAGDGQDTLSISNSSIDALYADFGRGNDTLLIRNLWARLVSVTGGDGNDYFKVINLNADQATFNGGNHFDVYREPITPPNRIRRFHLVNIERIEPF